MKRDLYKVFKPLKTGMDQILFGKEIIRGIWLKEVYLERIYKSEGRCTVYVEDRQQKEYIKGCLLPTLSLRSSHMTGDCYTVHENDVLLCSVSGSDYDLLADHFVVEYSEEKREFQLRSILNGAIEDISFASECCYIGNAYSFPDLKKEGARWSKK